MDDRRGGHVTEGPEIIIMRQEGKWIQHFRPIVRPAAKLERAELSEEQVTKFTRELGEFMLIADKEIDLIESLRGMAAREKQARMNRAMKETGAYGIGGFGYSLELRQGGQTLKTADAFADTTKMFEWMRSQEPKGAEKP